MRNAPLKRSTTQPAPVHTATQKATSAARNHLKGALKASEAASKALKDVPGDRRDIRSASRTLDLAMQNILYAMQIVGKK